MDEANGRDFCRIFKPEQISQVLSLNKGEMDDRFPIQEVSTGLPFIIIPLKTLDALKQAKVIRDKYFELIKDTQAKAMLIFCPQTYNQENDLNIRFLLTITECRRTQLREVQMVA